MKREKKTDHKAAKRICAALAVLLILTGCQKSGAENSVMPQNVPSDVRAVQATEPEEESTAAQMETAQAAAATAPEETGAASGTQTAEELLEALYAAKAEKEALDADEDILEAQVRTGAITREEFETRERERDLKEEQAEQEEERLERELRATGFRDRDLLSEEFVSSLESMDLQELLTLLGETESEQDLLELGEDRLELRYLNGEITRDEYVAQQKEYERNDDLYDAREDEVEYYLKLLGWDD